MKIKNIVINLDRRRDRYEEFLSTFKQNSHQRFSAIDGQVLKNKRLSKLDNMLLKKFKQSQCCPPRHFYGVLGCWRSHLGVWDQLNFDDEHDAYLIMEDDLRVSENFFSVLEKIYTSIDESFDIYYLGGRFVKDFMPKNLSSWNSINLNGFDFYVTNPSNYGYEFDRGLFCYILTKKGSKKLINNITNDLKNDSKFVGAVDEWIYRNRGLYNLCDVLPHISWSPSGYKSDIR